MIVISVGKLQNLVKIGLGRNCFVPFWRQFSEGTITLVPGSEGPGAISRNPHLKIQGTYKFARGYKNVPEGCDLVNALASGIASLTQMPVKVIDRGDEVKMITYILVKLPDPGRVTGNFDAVPVFEEVTGEICLGSFSSFRSEPVDLWGDRDPQKPKPALSTW